MAVVTDAQRKNPALRGWVAAKDKENAGGNTQAQMMASNSAEWHGATPQVQAQLHQANLDIAKQTGQTYNPGAGTYSAPKDTAANTAPPPPKNDASLGGSGNVGTTTPTGITQALSQMPSYTPPASSGLNFDQATNQVKGQLDPMFQRALEALKAQQHQDQLNGDQLGMARGGSHSGLAADLQNKVNIGAAGKAADLDATRQTQIAQMAQALVERGQDVDFRNQQQKLAEYLGLNQLDLQRAGLTGTLGGQQTLAAKSQDQNYGLNLAGLTGNIGGQQTLQAKGQAFDQNLATNQFNQGVKNDTFNQGMANKQFDYQKVQDDIKNGQWSTTTENQMKQWAEGNKLDWAQFNQQTKQALAQLAISQQNANTSAFSASNSASNAASNKELDNLYRQWDATGKAPAGIPGVTAGTSLYDKTAVRQEDAQQDKDGKLNIKAYETERDGMLDAVRTGRKTLPDAMAQINQDEKLGVYTADLSERLRANLRVLSGNQVIQGDTAKTPEIKIDTSKMNFSTPSVTNNVRG